MLVSGFVTIVASGKEVATILKELNLATSAANILTTLQTKILEKYGISATVSGVAATGAAAGTTTLTGAIRGLGTALMTTPLGAYTAALGAIGLALGTVAWNIGEAEKKQEQYKEHLQSVINEEKELQETIDSSNYKNLYLEYEATGRSSDALKDAALSLADALGIVGASALAESGNFEILNDRIQEATESHSKLQEAALTGRQASISGSGQMSYKPFQHNLRTDIAETTVNEEFGLGFTSYSTPDKTYAETIGILVSKQKELTESTNKLTEAIAKEEAELAKAQAIGDTKVVERLTNSIAVKKESLQEQNDLLAETSKYLTDEIYQVQEFRENLQSLAELKISDLLSIEGMELSPQEIYNKILQTDAFKDYVAVEGEEAGHQLALSMMDSFSQSLIEDIPTQTEYQTFLLAQGVYDRIDNGELDEEYRHITDTILNSGYDKETTIQLVGSLGKEVTLDNINEVLEQLNNGKEFDDLKLQGKLDTSNITNLEYDDETFQEILKTAGMSEATFDSYNEKLFRNSELLQEQQKNTQKLTELRKQLLETTDDKEYIRLSQSIQKLSSRNEELAQTMHDITTAAVETQNGLNQLATVTDDQFSALRSGEKFSEDYISGLETIKSAIAQVLNVSKEEVGTEFIENNLENIYALAEGDISQIDNLRSAMSQEAIMKLDIQ